MRIKTSIEGYTFYFQNEQLALEALNIDAEDVFSLYLVFQLAHLVINPSGQTIKNSFCGHELADVYIEHLKQKELNCLTTAE